MLMAPHLLLLLLSTAVLLHVNQVQCEYRSYDGSDNHLDMSQLGASNTPYIRIQVPTIDNSSSRPNPRLISNLLAQVGLKGMPKNSVYLNELHTYFGQFIVIDSMKTSRGSSRDDITVPACDRWMDDQCTGNQSIPFTPSNLLPDSTQTPINQVSHYFDLSPIYGLDESNIYPRLDNATGKIFMPELSGSSGIVTPSDPAWILSGDIRINEDPGLLTVASLFTREHNRLVDELTKSNTSLTPIEVFRRARRWNIALYQKVISREYLASTIGEALPPYSGYKKDVDPSTDIFVATTSFRYAHSAITDKFARYDNSGSDLPEGHLPTLSSVWTPSEWKITRAGVCRHSIPELFIGLANTLAAEIDVGYVDEVRHFTFGPLRGGLDLLAVDIQRGRDHKFPDYNSCRQALGLPKAQSFNEITNNTDLSKVLQSLYGSVDNVDPIVGLISEAHSNGLSVGPLTKASLKEEFTRKRDGDRFWYENTDYFTAEEVQAIHGTSLRDLLVRNFPEESEEMWVRVFPLSGFYVATRQLGVFGDDSTLWPPLEDTYPPHCTVIVAPSYQINWFINKEEQTITFILQVKTFGWIGIGFESDPYSMKNADIVICRILRDTAECLDYFARDVGIPTLDTALGGTNDILSFEVERPGGSITRAVFTKRMSSGDKWDHNIGLDNQKVLFAFNPTTSELQYHGPTRSWDSINLYSDYISALPLLEQSYPLAMIITISALTSIGVAFTIICFIFVVVKIDYFSHLTPVFCILILVGTLIGYTSIFVGLFARSDAMCTSQVWLIGLSYVFVYPCLYVRVYRVWIITRNAEKLKKVTITITHILIPVIVLLLIEFAYLLIWTLLDPPSLHKISYYPYGIFHSCFKEISTNQTLFWAISLSEKIFLLLLGIFLAFKTRHVEKSLNESKHVALCIYGSFVVVLIILPLSFLLNESPVVTMIASTLGYGIILGVVTAVLFGGVIVDILRGKQSVAERWRNSHKANPSPSNTPTPNYH